DSGQVALVSGFLDAGGLPDLAAYGVDADNQPCSIGFFLNSSGSVATPTSTATPTPGTSTPASSATPSATVPTPTVSPTPTFTRTATATAIPTAPYGVCNTKDNPQIHVGRPAAVASGDFNSDADGDIAVADNSGNQIVIILSNINMSSSQKTA